MLTSSLLRTGLDYQLFTNQKNLKRSYTANGKGGNRKAETEDRGWKKNLQNFHIGNLIFFKTVVWQRKGVINASVIPLFRDKYTLQQ